MSLVTILVTLLVVALVVIVIFYIIDQTGIPSPANWIAKVIVAIVAVLIVLNRSGVSLGL